MRYYFGLYHWRRHRMAVAELLVSVVAVLATLAIGPRYSVVLLLGALALGVHAVADLRTLFKPSPWHVDRDRFDRLAASLPLDTAGTVIDLGCGTGRSFVGLAPHLPAESRVIGVDRFDDHVILGNSPGLAERNAREAGVDVEVVTGDATALPFETDAADVVTISQVLHDLPEPAIRSFLREARRICHPDGSIGLVELPLVNDETAVSPEFWREAVETTGLTVTSMETVPWKGGQSKAIITASANPSSPGPGDENIPAGTTTGPT